MSSIEVSPQNSYGAVLTPKTSDCNQIWRKGLQRGDQVKMGSLGQAVIWYDWCPSKNRRLGHRSREDHVRTSKKMCLEAKDRGLQRN